MSDKITIKNPGKITQDEECTEVEVTVESYADVSDGYHTIEELYDHRITLYIALCRNVQAWLYPPGERNARKDGYDKLVWRSKKHHDGSSYDGWFIMGIGIKKGEQISYHLPMSRWDDTAFADTCPKAPAPFDGHSSADVLERIATL